MAEPVDGTTPDDTGAIPRRRSSLERLVVVAAAGLAAGIVVAFFGPWEVAVLAGWDLAALIYLVWIWGTVWSMDARSTRAHAGWEDPSRAIADSMIIGAALASLAAVSLILVKAAGSRGGAKAFFLTMSVLSVVLAWMTVHTTFTLRYAHHYYGQNAGGVDFHQGVDLARYSDFAYLAFTIGMTFQVSDTDLTTEVIRRTSLQHALISYLFGAVILGLIINVVSSLLH